MAKEQQSVRVPRRKRWMPIKDYLSKLRGRGLNDEGVFIPSGVPMAPPIGYKKQPSMVEIVRNMVKSERLAAAAREMGHETFEESEDFDIGDDGEDLRSGFENDFDPPIEEIKVAVDEEKKRSKPKKEPPEPVEEKVPLESQDGE